MADMLRQFGRAIRDMPAFLEARIVAWLRKAALSPHLPVDIEGEMWCIRDRKPWPCETFVRLTTDAEGRPRP